jgi:hypothetical protein
MYGPTATITTAAGQRITAHLSTTIEVQSNTSSFVDYNYYPGICYRPTGSSGATVISYYQLEHGYYTLGQIVWAIDNVSGLSGTIVPGAGTWDVGICVENTGNTVANLSYVAGDIEITN